MLWTVSPLTQHRTSGVSTENKEAPRVLMKFRILPERVGDAEEIEPLLDRSFGSDRLRKTVYRLREGIAPVPELCFVAVEDDGRMLASLRFWPIRVEETPALLFGPLAVEPKIRGRGVGRTLVRHGLDSARLQGHRLCIVVGEANYYSPYGFVPATPMGLVMPGPVEPARFQVLELAPGALEGARGLIGRDERCAPGSGSRRSPSTATRNA